MRMMLVALAITAVAAPGAAKDRDQIPEATPTGKPQDCVTTNRIRTTHVRNDRVIDFEMNGGQIYRNTLPQGCPGLNFERAFSYRTSVGQLCSVDIISVIRVSSAIQGPSCGLGQFQPVTLVRK